MIIRTVWIFVVNFLQLNYTLLHYAAVSAKPDAYEQACDALSPLPVLENLFGHKPIDYAHGGFDKLTKLDQAHLINRFVTFIDIENRDVDINIIKNGVCFAIAFINAIDTLRNSDFVSFSQIRMA